MTSEITRAYVWTWLGGSRLRTSLDRNGGVSAAQPSDQLERGENPVVAGALDVLPGGRLGFVYGRSYLQRPDAVSLYEPELPLVSGQQLPGDTLEAPGCIADGAPDAWGRRVILHRLHGGGTRDVDTTALPLLTYLLQSGSDRIGANDFQRSPDVYEPRTAGGTLEELLTAADRLQAGEPFSPQIDAVLNAASSVGGARPKAVLRDPEGVGVIAKFGSVTDHFPIVLAEAVGMELARQVGLDTAGSHLVEVLGRDVLLVDRFDRVPGRATRRGMVSALTMLGLHEMHARYATYPDFADVVRARFEAPADTLSELFRRVVFNVLIGNTDDHARNHAAFWDGTSLRLTPAYDLCPYPRDTGEAAQAMAIGRDGSRLSQLKTCVDASEVFLLDRRQAVEETHRQITLINERWIDAADLVGLTAADRNLLWGRAVMHPFALQDLPSA